MTHTELMAAVERVLGAKLPRGCRDESMERARRLAEQGLLAPGVQLTAAASSVARAMLPSVYRPDAHTAAFLLAELDVLAPAEVTR